MTEPEPAPQHFFGGRYLELTTAALLSYLRRWLLVRNGRRERLADRALAELPSPASTKVADTIRTIMDERVLAGIERWLDDKRLQAAIAEDQRARIEAAIGVETHELEAPIDPAWCPPRAEPAT